MALSTYLDDAVAGIIEVEDSDKENVANSSTIVVEAADTMACRSSIALLEEESSATAETPSLRRDPTTGIPAHQLSDSELQLMKTKWPLGVLGERAFSAHKKLSAIEKGLWKTQLLSGVEESKQVAADDLERALSCKQFTGLVRKIEVDIQA
eukprot:1136939-Amorphochlora_amoeboformis.AAC.1